MFAGWYFIRNGIIYNGDFLGIQATRKCGEINAMEQYKPSNRTNMYNQGKTMGYVDRWLLGKNVV